MAWIDLGNELPGIRGLMQYRPESALALNKLAEALLCSNQGLTKGERELIATYVSELNQCNFCKRIHGAVAAYYCGEALVEQIRHQPDTAAISQRLRTLLSLAAAVQCLNRDNLESIINQARSEKISDLEIHDTVLIAASFCMFNRYVDGLGTFAPDDPDLYKERARLIAEETGYLSSRPS